MFTQSIISKKRGVPGLIFALAVGVSGGVGCKAASAGGGHAHGAGGHAHGGEAHGDEAHDDHGHGHASADGRPMRTLLAFGERYEFFAEYPALVEGKRSTFAVHVSALEGYEPLSEGDVSVVLTGEGAPGERFAADHAHRPGIFEVTVTPEHTGERRLFVSARPADGQRGSDRVSIGSVTVHPSVDAAKEAAEDGGEGADHEAAHGATNFSKEQQWRFDFGTAEALRRKLRPSLAVDARVTVPSEGEATVRAPVAGGVSAVGSQSGLPEVGDEVEAGDALAAIAPKVAGGDDLAKLRLEVERAKVALDRARRDEKRLERLFADEAIAEKRLLNARDEVKTAEAELDAARRRLRQRRSLGGGSGTAAAERVVVRAPISGTVVARDATAGAYVGEGGQMFRILDGERLRVEAAIPEGDLARIDEPSGLWFAHGEEGRKIHELSVDEGARLVHVGGAVDRRTRTAPLVVEMVDPPVSLRVGQYLRAHVWTSPGRETLAVPADALLEEKGKFVAFVMVGGESFERRVVRTGIRDRGLVEITDGLGPGERVVTRGAYLVKLAGASTGSVGHGHTH